VINDAFINDEEYDRKTLRFLLREYTL